MSNDETCTPPWKRLVDTCNPCRDARSVRPLCQSETCDDETCNPCRDARECLAGRRPSPLKPTNAVTFDTTDALPLDTPVRPYKGLLDRASLHLRALLVHVYHIVLLAWCRFGTLIGITYDTAGDPHEVSL